jgi:hypothetical protein
VPEDEREFVERFKFYNKLAIHNRSDVFFRVLKSIARFRTKRDRYMFPIEKSVLGFVRHQLLHKTNW